MFAEDTLRLQGTGAHWGVDRAGYLSSLQPTIKSGQTCKTATKR